MSPNYEKWASLLSKHKKLPRPKWSPCSPVCHVSRVRCHMSPVKCHVSPVPCQKNYIFFFNGKSVGASRWRVCYQRGLPRLVCNTNCIKVTFVYKPLIKPISHQLFSPQILMFFNCCNITFFYIFFKQKKIFYNFASHSQKPYTFPMFS